MDEPFVHIVDSDINHTQLEKEIYQLINDFDLHNQDQISLTSIDGNNDWNVSTGKMVDLPHPERYFAEINTGIMGTLIEKYIKQFSKFYRWFKWSCNISCDIFYFCSRFKSRSFFKY